MVQRIGPHNPRLLEDLGLVAGLVGRALHLPGGHDLLATLVDYLVAVTRIDKDILGKRLAEINPALEEAYMTILEAINQEAETRGRAHTLTMQLEAKFGPLPTWARESIDDANLEQLDSWTIGLLTATTLQDVFGA